MTDETIQHNDAEHEKPTRSPLIDHMARIATNMAKFQQRSQQVLAETARPMTEYRRVEMPTSFSELMNRATSAEKPPSAPMNEHLAEFNVDLGKTIREEAMRTMLRSNELANASPEHFLNRADMGFAHYLSKNISFESMLDKEGTKSDEHER